MPRGTEAGRGRSRCARPGSRPVAGNASSITPSVCQAEVTSSFSKTRATLQSDPTIILSLETTNVSLLNEEADYKPRPPGSPLPPRRGPCQFSQQQEQHSKPGARPPEPPPRARTFRGSGPLQEQSLHGGSFIVPLCCITLQWKLI